MARLSKPDMKVFSKVLLPLAAPTVFTSSIFLFLFCLLDYTVPSLFGVNLYSLEIFASFSADYHTGNAVTRSLPIILLVVPVALILSRNVKQLMTTVKHKNHSDASLISFPPYFVFLQITALIILFLQFGVPVARFLAEIESPAGILDIFSDSGQEILSTLLIAFLSALLILPFAWLCAEELCRNDRRSRLKRTAWWTFVIAPLVLPAPLIGIGLVQTWNSVPLMSGSLFLPVFASFIRFFPYAALVMTAWLKRQDETLVDAARIHQRSTVQTFFMIRIPLCFRGLLISFCLTFVLAAGELGATLLVIPAGFETLSIKIYNFLHYGQSSEVASLCLLMYLVPLLIGIASVRLFATAEKMS